MTCFKSYLLQMLMVFLLLLTHFVNAQQSIRPNERIVVSINQPKEKVHLYLLAGQSNMAGRARVEASDTIGHPRILMLNKNKEWEIAKEPIQFDKKIVGLGPGLAFAREMIKKDSTIIIGLIPAAVGGTSVDVWKTGAIHKQTNLFPFDRAVAMTKKALEVGMLKAILWHQGESDASPEKRIDYETKLKSVFENLRSEFTTPNLPIIAGTLPIFKKTKNKKERKKINKKIFRLKKEINNYRVVKLKRPKDKGDVLHLDRATSIQLGKAYAKKLQKYFEK